MVRTRNIVFIPSGCDVAYIAKGAIDDESKTIDDAQFMLQTTRRRPMGLISHMIYILP